MKKILKNSSIVLGLIILIYGLFFADSWIKGNFHIITNNQAYRSRQLDKQLLKYYITKYNIKSIINLRGEEKGADWYDDEMYVSSIYNVFHYDLDLPMDKMPKDKDMQTLLDIFKTAPRPVLIHCLGGSDRTGLASTLWKILIDKENKCKASRHMLFYYGHMPFGKARVLDKWLDEHEIMDGEVIKVDLL